MWFLIRTFIWLTLLLVVPLVQALILRPKNLVWVGLALAALPVFGNHTTDGAKAGDGIELTDALGAAAGAISYMSSLCSEKPDVCDKGAKTFAALGSQARDGASAAYGYFNPAPADDDAAKPADAVLTGSVAARDERAREDMSRIPIPEPRPANI